jgi:aspartate aminotransferase
MRISSRLSAIQPSATLTLNAKAAELKAQGRDVISLAAGEPDFSPPEVVIQAARSALDQGCHRYTPVGGLPELLEAVAGYFASTYGVKAGKDMAVVTNGGKQGLYNLFQALLNQGDEVLIPAPYWVSYPDMVSLSGGVPLYVPTQPEENFLATPDSLERFVGPKTRLLVLNTPSNPTGCHYTQQQLDAIVSWAVDRGLFVVSDEIYDQLVFPPAGTASVCGWFETAPEQIAVVNGLSKSLAMTGWRVGYVLGHPELIKSMIKLQGQTTSNICTIAQKAALAALTSSWDFLQEKRQVLVRRRDSALEIMAGWPGVHCPKPDGAFYLFPRLDELYTAEVPDSNSLCGHLLEEAGVALVPGSAFGDDRCLRFSYAVDDETLHRALERVGRALSKLRTGRGTHG